MKRLLSIVALAAALTLGTGGSAMAHTITVTTPDGTTILNRQPLAKDLTPDLFDEYGNHVGYETGEYSAASQGTNTACVAVPVGGVVNILGGTCPKD